MALKTMSIDKLVKNGDASMMKKVRVVSTVDYYLVR